MEVEDTQVERTANIAAADATVVGMLLSEIVDALRARNFIKDEDIAGALLRTEYRAEMADKFGEEDGDIFNHHAAVAGIATSAWQGRLTLEPILYALRKRQHEWIAAGQPGESPLHAERIVEEYRDEEDEG